MVALGSGVLLTPTGIMAPILARADGGHLVRTPCHEEAFVRSGTVINGTDVVIDAGHGGNQSGAVAANGLTERALNLVVATHLESLLKEAGFSVQMTRRTNMRYSLSTRAEIAVALDAKLFVSVHHNGVSRVVTPGAQVFHQYGNADSRRLAGLLYEEGRALLGAYGVTWPATNSNAGARYRLSPSGPWDYYGVLRRSAPVPAIITELMYMTNPAEAALLADPAFQAAEARAIARAITRFFQTQDPGSGFTKPLTGVNAGSGASGPPCVDPRME